MHRCDVGKEVAEGKVEGGEEFIQEGKEYKNFFACLALLRGAETAPSHPHLHCPAGDSSLEIR